MSPEQLNMFTWEVLNLLHGPKLHDLLTGRKFTPPEKQDLTFFCVVIFEKIHFICVVSEKRHLNKIKDIE